MDIWVFVAEQWLLITILAVLLAAFVVLERRRGGASLSHHEVTRLVNAGEAVLIDIRDKDDFKAGHIVDSINIPFAKLADQSAELDKHKNSTLVLIDKMGQHAGTAAKSLKEKGFNVVRLQGGIMEWQAQNLPLVKA
ncbi:rhodanese-like domain-containing protein [Agaribacterium haliotis]|uniref:rhodanese-like domain-containing protein n=1 Tax=Agaribacterium haliotis TaxID=2013869 RepID=UPI000BB53EC0|nr:rhodanese-like domain-containing protein [Agaribacterium haliotis]